MNKKTFIIIGVFICLLFAIPMASATDVDVHNGLAIESAAADFSMDAVNNASVEDSNSIVSNAADSSDSNIIPDNNNLSGIQYDSADVKNSKTLAASNDNVLGADGTGNTFADLQYLIDHASGTLTLDRDFNFVSGSDDDHANGIIINNTLTINGGGHTIDAKNLARIFNISASNVQLNNLILINGKSAENGGAIYIQTQGGETNLENITLKFCEAENGGGIYTVTPTAMKNITAINCTATGNGGAIFAAADGTDVALDIFNLYNNTALNGGAFYTHGDNIKITNVDAQNNTAQEGHGGAIYWKGYNGTVEGSNFSNNTNVLGGAIYIEGNMTKVNDCNFTNNSAVKGGAILVQGNNATINLSNFVGHNTDEEGGAVYVNGTGTSIDNSTFTNNTSHDDGGAIAWWGNDGKVYNVTCFNNSGIGHNHKSSGGTMSIYGSNISMDKLNITLGYVTSDQGQVSKGGGMFITGNNVNITNSSFTNCSAQTQVDDSSAGALYIIGNNTNVINCNFTNNTAWEDGGAVFVEGQNCTFNNTVFINNTAHNDGGAIEWRGNNGTIYNLTADNCIADSVSGSSKGGALLITGDSMSLDVINITNCHVSGEHYTGDKTIQGGAIFLTGNDCNITNASFDHCYADFDGDDTSGGAMYVLGNNTIIVNANFTNNYATEDGGSLFIEGQNCILNNTVFINSTAHNDGGAIEWQGSNGKIYNLTADNCYADSAHGSSKGGALIITGDNISIDCANISNSYVDGLSSSRAVQGGAIFLTGNGCNVTNSSFTNCSVKWTGTNASGGAMYILGNNTYMANANFTNNTASQEGGAIYVSGTDFKFNRGNFTNNNANLRGGAIFLTDNKNSEINKTYFENNSAGLTGGAINFYEGAEDGLVSSCDFVNNKAGASGGSVYWEGTRGVIEYSNFTGSRVLGNQSNSALAPNNGRGGSVMWLGDHGIIRGCDFNDSASSKEGASLYVKGDMLKVYYSNFTNTQTNTSGGIYVEGSDAIISHAHMENTTAKENGGALYVKGNYITLSDSDIYNATSVKDGAAIYVSGNTTHIENSNVTNSKATNGDGAILIAGYKTVMDGCNVVNNSAKNAGAIKITGSETSISNSNITHNNATSAVAGAIWINGDDNLIATSNVSDNYAATNGGGIYYQGNRNTVSYCNIDHNSAKIGGNVFMTSRGVDCKLIGSNITNGRARDNYGGGVEWEGSSVNGLIQDCYFYNDTAKGHGGAIHWWPGTDGVVDNCTFVDCHVDDNKNGGAIYAGATSGDPKGTVLSNSTFINCTSGTRGVVTWNVQDGLIYNNTFINCGRPSGSTSYGGNQALQIQNGNNAQIIACEFYNCTGIGGGTLSLNIDSKGQNITIANCTFDNCSNTGDGGAIYSNDKGKDLIIENNTITNCNASNGGGMYLTSGATVKSFVNNTFINNTASGGSGNAGAAMLSSGTEVINSTFIANSANNAGGAIFAHSTLVISGSTFENNTATNNGGAISANNGNNGHLYINESTFKYNKANTGSAIRSNDVVINDSVLLENQALFNRWANQRHSLTDTHASINGTFVGNDNLLNAIQGNTYSFRNVTYCGVDGGGLYEAATTNTNVVLSDKSNNEVHQIIIVEIYDSDNYLVDTVTGFTDANGKYNIEIDIADAKNLAYKIMHPEDNYYTGAEYTIGKALSNLTITSQNITHPEDENISFQVTGGLADVPSGNITVIINDTNGNIIYNDTISLNETGEATLSLPRLNATEYYIYAKYNGDDNYLPDNETDVFHVSMGESFINIGIENYTYNETRNITITVPYIEDGKISVIVSNENFTQLYTIYVSEGTEEILIQLPILDAGEYEIEAVFHGNNNYFPSQNTTNFTVYKAASIINVSAENVSGGVNPIVNIHVDPEVATQNINVTVYDEAGNIVAQYEDLGLHDSSYSITLPVLPKGKYNVTVHYSGDKNHNESDNDTIFYVTNNLFPIEINATNMTYGEDQIINITVPANADPDKLWIKLNWTENKTVTDLGLTIDPDTGLIQIDTSLLPSRLDVGNYTIDVYYEGDEDYLSNSSSFTFEVVKAEAEIIITPENIPYNDIEDIVIEISPEKAQSGTVDIYVTSDLDPSLNITIKDLPIDEYGKVYWNVNETILPVGTYYIEAVYSGNENYNGKSEYSSFEVYKAVPTIVIDVNNIYVGEDEVINITVNPNGEYGVTGNVTILVRTLNETKVLNATGQTSLTLENEVEGYGITVMVIYNGDSNFNSTVASTHYNVTKRNTTITVDGDSPISYGTIENLVAQVNETGVTGTITIYVNSTVDGFRNQTHVATITVDDEGRATWDIDEIVLPVGSYNVTAVYSGDDKYNGNTSTIKVIVVEKNSTYEISVEANNTVYGTNQVIIVTVPDNANGTVTITIAGTEIILTENVVNGKAVFTIPTDVIDYLEVHVDYNVTATYNGDDKYEAGQTDSDLFNVSKAESHINIVAEDIDYTQIENITVSLPDANASGKIVITITNKSDSTQVITTLEVDPFVNTAGVIYPFEGLLAGNYTVKVEYSGDHNYNDSEDTADFEVRKVDPALTESSPNIVYGIDENITVAITGAEGGLAPTGTIEVKVDGVTIDTITIGEKGLEYIVSKPAVDPRHNVTVIYSGDGNYNPVTITGEFAVTQNSTIELEEDSPNIVYGNNETITITLPNDATGTVYLVVNGSYYTPISIDENHQAVFNITAPVVGEYNFTAYYSGDGNYTANNISGAFNVTKANVTLAETHAATITYGANNTITVTITGVEGPEGVLAPTGTIKVLVDGNEIGNITIGNDLVFTSIKPFVDSQHNITIVYSGDNNYNGKSIDNTVLDTLVFEVTKNNTVEISEDSPNIDYGENETITVTIAGDATGTITVTVGGEQVGETVNITEITEDDKVFTFNITKPDGGTYDDLTVVYSGDSNYDDRTIYGEFTVSPVDPNITEDSPDIVYTNNETIAITVPEGATGTLTVTVKNSKGETVETKELVIGTDNLVVTLEKPSVDNYTFTVEYSGCANYTAKTITGEFKVTKASNEIAVVPTNITYGQTETITVTIPEGATGSVTISIGSYTDTADIAEGASEVVFTIPKTAADALLKVNENYVVFANYSGDDNFESAIANAPFHVDPANTTLTIVVANITYGEDEIISITVNGVENGDVPTGFVTIRINGTDIELSKRVDGEGKVQFNVTGLVAGEYTVNATFESSSINYNDRNNAAGFNVTKADIEEANMNITAVNITYGDDETITVIFNEYNVTGNVTITINGTEIETKELEDGKVVFIVPDLEVNGYNVIANYSGDHNYNAITIGDNFNTDFKVDKANVTVEVTPVDIIYKETEEINVTVAGVFINDNVKDNLTGKVTIYIDGVENQTKDISAADENGMLHFSVEGLAVGTHNVTAVYHDDRNYNDKNDTKDFEVINALPENMQVIPQNITYHIQTETITVDLGEVLNGTIQLYINDTIVATFNVIDQSSVSYTNSSLAVGNYTAKAVFTANGDSVEASANFTVSKAPVTVTVVADDSTYGETQNITVTVDNTVPDKFNLTGNVSITINGVDYGNKTVNASGQAVFEIDGLEANENYVVIATYYNDSNYLDNNGQDTFKVSKADVKDTNKNITAINITYGEDETITVTLNEDNITGKVTITINGSEIDTKELEDGKAVFTVKDLEVNGYNVVANYSGDVNYNPFTIADNLNTDFTVGKANSTVEVEAIPSIVYGNNETITVTVPIRNHTGTVTLTINGTDYEFIKHLTAEDGDSIVLTNVSGLAVGLYNVTVKYEGDRNYNDSENSTLFEVTQAEPASIVVEPQNITYGQIENITVTVSPVEGYATPSGNVTITIVGTDIVKTLNLTDGSVTFNIPDLEVETYMVEAVYSGDVNYTGINGMNVFKVSPAASNVTIEVANITYGDTEYANITIPNINASGRVIITVDGNIYQSSVLTNDTPINLALGDLAVGEHTIDVEYFGDHNYNDSSAHAVFTVSPANSSVIIATQNITYQDIENITVTVPVNNATGTLVVRINGSEINRTKFNGENSPEIVINVADLAVGEYNVTAEYIDDVNYNNSANSSIFHVDKANITDINLTALNITYGENGTVTITINDKNATGNITIKVNGTEYGPEELVDGTISFNIPDLSAGDYDVTAYYSGDDNYNATEAQTTFNVDKATPTVYAVGTNITYGSSEQITVIVDGKNITGNVTIFIDGDEIDTKDLTQISTGGRAVFNVPGLSGGNHTVVAVYNGDDNHYSSSGEDNFTVSKANPTVDVNTSNIDYGEVENITITVNPVEGGETPTGNVTVTVTGPDGYTQTFEEVPIVDGNITIPMNDLPAGNYSVKVTYNGDENYNAANATGNFSIGKLDPTVNIDVSNITYGENETITVTVTGADGKAVPTGTVNITVNGVTYEDQELTDGKVTITVPGLTPDTYPVSVSYGGDQGQCYYEGQYYRY